MVQAGEAHVEHSNARGRHVQDTQNELLLTRRLVLSALQVEQF